MRRGGANEREVLLGGECPTPMSTPPPLVLETLRGEIHATERKAGLLLLVAVVLLLFVLHETHEELKEGEVPMGDLWAAFAGVGLSALAAIGGGAVFLGPGACGLAPAPPSFEGPIEDQAAPLEAERLRRAARRKARLLAITAVCLLVALIVVVFVYVKGFWLPHVTFDRGAQPA